MAPSQAASDKRLLLGYADITSMYNTYTHHVIIHEHNFVDPQNDNIHTQNVENMWGRLKTHFKRMRGTRREMVQSYVAHFTWQSNFVRNNDPLSSLFYCIAQQYAFE
jgi:hypothetical protein